MRLRIHGLANRTDDLSIQSQLTNAYGRMPGTKSEERAIAVGYTVTFWPNTSVCSNSHNVKIELFSDLPVSHPQTHPSFVRIREVP